MSQTNCRRPATVLLAISLASLLLAACGGSSGGGSSSSASPTAADSTGQSPATSSTASTALSAKAPSQTNKSNTKPPSSTATAPPATSSAKATAPPPSGTPTTPATVSGAVAALRACLQRSGATAPTRGANGVAQFPSTEARQRYAAAVRRCLPALRGRLIQPSAPFKTTPGELSLGKFVQCMHQRGITIHINTSGSGPILDTKGLDTKSRSFKSAAAACKSLLPAISPRGVG